MFWSSRQTGSHLTEDIKVQKSVEKFLPFIKLFVTCYNNVQKQYPFDLNLRNKNTWII